MERKNVDTHRLVMASLLAGIGLLLPYATSHAFGVPGTVLLPMHLPVLLCGLLCGPKYGGLCGFVVPVLSCLTTGMPVAYPMLPIMACELMTYGLVAGICYQKRRLPLYAALLLAMVAGRVVYGLVFSLLLLVASGPLKALSVTAAVTTGIPGILIQLAVIPPLVRWLTKKATKTMTKQEPAPMVEPGLAQAQQLVQAGKASCVIIQQGQAAWQGSGRGVGLLIDLYEQQPQLLQGATVVDKIIGKAAAMLLVLGGAKAAYGEVMSVAARDYLTARGIAFSYGRCVDLISNREGNGICPMERTVLELDDPREGYQALRQTLAKLRSAG